MRRPPVLKPVAWRQLCAITRSILETDLAIDDAEWAARIKDRLPTLGLTYPESSGAIQRAMSAVEAALEKRGSPRPPPVLPPPVLPAQSRPPQQDNPPWNRHERGRQQWTSIGAFVADLMENIRNSKT